MTNGTARFYELKRHFLAKLLDAPSTDICDHVAYVVNLRSKGQGQLVIVLARPRLNKDYAESAFKGTLRHYSRYAGMDIDFQLYYSESNNTIYVIQPEDTEQKALLAAISDILKEGSQEKPPKLDKKIIIPRYVTLVDNYIHQLAKKPKVGYDIEKLDLREKDGTLDAILKGDTDPSFNRRAIISNYKTSLEDCLTSLDLYYLLNVDYVEESRKLSISIKPNDAKAKAILSAIALILEREIVGKPL